MAIDVANFLPSVFKKFPRIVMNFCTLREGDCLDSCSEDKIITFKAIVLLLSNTSPVMGKFLSKNSFLLADFLILMLLPIDYKSNVNILQRLNYVNRFFYDMCYLRQILRDLFACRWRYSLPDNWAQRYLFVQDYEIYNPLTC